MVEKKQKNSKKEMLFSAAMRIIGERGYNGTSVDEIAARAGVAKGVVYYYFDSKAALAEQLISTGLEALAVRLDRSITDDMTASEAIEALAREQMRQVNKRKDFAKFLLSEMWREDREWRETLDRSLQEIVDIYEREIRRGVASGEFKQDPNVEFIAQTIFATFLAGALNWTVVHPELDADSIASQLATYALAGLVVNDNRPS